MILYVRNMRKIYTSLIAFYLKFTYSSLCKLGRFEYPLDTIEIPSDRQQWH